MREINKTNQDFMNRPWKIGKICKGEIRDCNDNKITDCGMFNNGESKALFIVKAVNSYKEVSHD